MLLRLFGGRVLQAAFAALMLMGLLAGCGGGRTDPTLNLSVTVDGTAIDGSPLSNSGSTTITLQSGQSLNISSNLTMDVVNSPAGATVSPLTRTGTSWIGTVNSDVATTMTLTLSSSDYPELSRTLTVNVVPTALAVTVQVDGATVNATPVGADDTYALTINSGQVLTVNANVKVDFGTDLGVTHTNNRVTNTTVWQATLTAGATGSPLTLTASPQGDSTRVATVQVTVRPSPLQILASASGSTAKSDCNLNAVAAGDTCAVSMSSGQTLSLSGSTGFLVSGSLNGLTQSQVTPSPDHKTWSAVFTGAAASTATLTLTSATDSTVFVTLLVSIDPLPLQLNLFVGGTQVNTTPMTNGNGVPGEYSFNVASGQDVKLQSGDGSSTAVKISVAQDLGDVSASKTSRSNVLWAATLTAAKSSAAVLTITPLGDSTRVVKITLNVAATPLAVTINTPAQSTPVLAGETRAINLHSGDTLAFTSTVAMSVAQTLGSITRSNLVVSADNKTWSATLTGPTASTATFVVTSATDPTVTATLLVSVDPTPMTLTLSSPAAAQVTSGQVYTLSINSGQTVTFDSNVPVSIAESLGDAHKGEGSSKSNTNWTAILVSGVATEVTLTVTPQGDSTRTATIKIQVAAAPLTATVSVAGVAVLTDVANGQSVTVNMKSNQLLRVDASINAIFEATLGGVTQGNYNQTDKSWVSTLASNAPTTVQLLVKSNADRSQIITINVVLDQLPFAVNLNIDTVQQSPSPIPSGSTQTYPINSGQKIAIGSSSGLPMDFSPSLGGATANNLSISDTLWAAVLTSRTATTATVTVTPQGAATPAITLNFAITPTILTVNDLSVNGVIQATGLQPSSLPQVLPTASANGGAGVTLRFTGSIDMVVTMDPNAAITVMDTSVDATTYYAKFNTSAATTIVLHAASVAEPTKIITINLPITP